MEDLDTRVLAEPHDAGAGEDRRPAPVVRAEAVSTAVLELLDGPRALRVRGEGRGVVHLDLDGAVITVAAPGVPRMPNAIVARAPAPPFAVAWDLRDPPAWDPVVPPLAGGLAEVRALCPADARDRTGALSATLLALAARGAAPEPVHRLLGGGDPAAALADLRRLGASTGAAIAEGIRIAAGYLVQTAG